MLKNNVIYVNIWMNFLKIELTCDDVIIVFFEFFELPQSMMSILEGS